MKLNDITAIIVESNTLDLTQKCLDSLLHYYPDLPLIVVDNASRDGSREMVVKMTKQHQSVAILNDRNVGHGPGMHQALTICQTVKALLLDSDCEVLSDHWLELMLLENAYLIGKQVLVDYGGITRESGEPYIHTSCAVIDVPTYRALPPFNHHGTPCLLNQRVARERGYALLAFDTDSHVYHLGAGTRKNNGYQIEGWVRLERPYPHQGRTASEMLRDNTAQIVISGRS